MKVTKFLLITMMFISGGSCAEGLVWYTVPSAAVGAAPAPAPIQMQFLAPNKITGNASGRYDELIYQAASRYAIDPLLIHAIVATESAYRPDVVSNKGAVGLMQLMPATAARFGKYNLTEPQDNIDAGVAYFSKLMQLFNGRLDLAIAGYNAGENAVLKYNSAIPPYPETQTYVARVMDVYTKLSNGKVAVPSVAKQPANTEVKNNNTINIGGFNELIAVFTQ